MLPFFNKKPGSVLGIDISASSINILQLSNTSGQYCVEGYGCTMYSQHFNTIDVIANSIQTLLVSANLSARRVILAVPDAYTINKIIQLNAQVQEKDIEEWVLMEAEKFIPYPLDEINLDFTLLGPCARNPALLDVRVVASRAEHVLHRVNMIRRAGLTVHIVDVESFAIERVARLWSMDRLFCGQHLALLDIHKSYIRCFVFNGDCIIYSREDSLEDLLDLSPSHELLLQKIKHTLQFYSGSIGQIILAGSLARLNNLEPFLQIHLGIPICIANPFMGMIFATTELRDQIERDAPMLTVACGLALRQ